MQCKIFQACISFLEYDDSGLQENPKIQNIRKSKYHNKDFKQKNVGPLKSIIMHIHCLNAAWHGCHQSVGFRSGEFVV